ncbi:MAG TPA: tagatose 1,6-diphosphate aldolase [Chloroflexota bacterium]|nr:tagatose 1,6-diphosphate aldolase [Chloroflexota bacterium]
MALSIGKLAGLRRLADDRGIFCITAMDQRTSLRVLVAPNDPQSVTPHQMTAIKIDLAATLSPHSTAVLLDPQYGAPQTIAAGALDPHVGLIVTLEADTPKKVGEGIVTQLADGWSVEKLERMGGDAVKLLVRYRPDLTESATENRAVVERVREQCRRWDIPFVLETVAYALSSESAQDFAKKKPHLVIETAHALSSLCDLYKAEFPDNLAFESDPAVLERHCRELDQASAVPWVILSAGANIGPFAQMVEIACRAGASGFLAGRAIWKDYVAIANPAERRDMLGTKAVHNLGMLTHVACRDALPWTRRPGVQLTTPAEFPPDWYQSY